MELSRLIDLQNEVVQGTRDLLSRAESLPRSLVLAAALTAALTPSIVFAGGIHEEGIDVGSLPLSASAAPVSVGPAATPSPLPKPQPSTEGPKPPVTALLAPSFADPLSSLPRPNNDTHWGFHGPASATEGYSKDIAQNSVIPLLKSMGVSWQTVIGLGDSAIDYSMALQQSGIMVVYRDYRNGPGAPTRLFSDSEQAVADHEAQAGIHYAITSNEGNLNHENPGVNSDCSQSAIKISDAEVQNALILIKKKIHPVVFNFSSGGDCDDLKMISDIKAAMLAKNYSFPNGLQADGTKIFDPGFTGGFNAVIGVHPYSNGSDTVDASGQVQFGEDGFMHYKKIAAIFPDVPEIATEWGPRPGSGYNPTVLQVVRFMKSNPTPLIAASGEWVLRGTQNQWQGEALLNNSGDIKNADLVNALKAS